MQVSEKKLYEHRLFRSNNANITTISSIYSFGQPVNLDNFAYKFKPNRHFPCLKYGLVGVKKIHSFQINKPKSKFHNQVSVYVNTGIKVLRKSSGWANNIVNIFIFRNGSIKISGAQNTIVITKAIRMLIAKFQELNKTNMLVRLENKDGLALDPNSYHIYSWSKNVFRDGEYVGDKNPKQIGFFMKRDHTYLKKKYTSNPFLFTKHGEVEVTIRRDYLIDTVYHFRDSRLVRILYSKVTGEPIGELYIDFAKTAVDYENKEYVQKGNRFYGKKSKFVFRETEEFCFEEPLSDAWVYKTKIGTERFRFYEYAEPFYSEPTCALYKTKCIETLPNSDPEYIKSHIKYAMINCSARSGYSFNVEDFIEAVIKTPRHRNGDYGVLEFDNESFSDAKFRVYPQGRKACICARQDCKCKITNAIFHSGQILFNGLKSFDDLLYNIELVLDLVETVRPEIEITDEEI